MSLKVLVFESDPAFAGELRMELTRLGLDVRIVDDGSAGLVAAVSDKPDLVLLSIELPRMNGFSVCNKLKKDPALKDVPLIIMSSESSEETFEQHKKLRTRAEDYVHKPIAFGELLEHIRPFIALDEPADRQADGDDGIVIDDDIELEEVDEGDFLDPSGSAGVDAEVEAFADSAFDHLLDETRPVAGASAENGHHFAAASFDPAANFAASAHDEPSAAYERVASFEPNASFEASANHGAASSFEAATIPQAATGFQPALFESAFPPATSSGSSRPRTSSHPAHPFFDPETDRLRKEVERQATELARLEHELATARAEVDRFEQVVLEDSGAPSEVVRLQRELDELRLKVASPGKAGGVSSRDFLDLREALNKKDKEILSLRDQISRKEKELLDASDTGLALEREKADIEDKIALLERELQSSRVAAENAKADKDQAAKRADDWKSRSEKLKVELEARLAELGSVQAKHDAEIVQREARIRERDVELAERSERIASLTEQHQSELASAEERSRAVLDDAQRAAEEQLRATVLELERSREAAVAKALEQAEAQRTASLQARENELTAAHEGRLAELERARQEAEERFREEISTAMREVDDARVRSEQREEELERQRAEHLDTQRAELERRREADVAVAEQRAAEQRASLEARHADERRDLLSQYAEVTSDLAKRTEERETLAGEASELRRSLAVSEAAAREADAELSTLRERFTVTSRKLDIATAHWEQNKTALERAKDALAAAVVQIEEAEARGLG